MRMTAKGIWRDAAGQDQNPLSEFPATIANRNKVRKYAPIFYTPRNRSPPPGTRNPLLLHHCFQGCPIHSETTQTDPHAVAFEHIRCASSRLHCQRSPSREHILSTSSSTRRTKRSSSISKSTRKMAYVRAVRDSVSGVGPVGKGSSEYDPSARPRGLRDSVSPSNFVGPSDYPEHGAPPTEPG